MAAEQQPGERLTRVTLQRRYREAGHGGRLRAVAESIDRRDEDSTGEWRDKVEVSRLRLTRQRSGGYRPLDAAHPIHGDRHERAHFRMVTVVPRPGSDAISNSSMSRRLPGSPTPNPLPVE